MQHVFDIEGIRTGLRAYTDLEVEEVEQYLEILSLSEEKFLKKFPELKNSLQGLFRATLDAIDSKDREGLRQLVEEFVSHESALSEHLAPRIKLSPGKRDAIKLLNVTRSVVTDRIGTRLGLPWDNSIMRALLVRGIQDKVKELINCGIRSTLNRDRYVGIHIDDVEEYREGFPNQISKLIAAGLYRNQNNPLPVIFNSSTPGILDLDYELKTRAEGSIIAAAATEMVWQTVLKGTVRLSYYWDFDGLKAYVREIKSKYTFKGILDENSFRGAITKSMTPYLKLDTLAIALVKSNNDVYSSSYGGVANVFGDYGFQYTFRSPQSTKYVVTLSRIGQPRTLLNSIYQIARQLPIVEKHVGAIRPLEFVFQAMTAPTEGIFHPCSDTIFLKHFHTPVSPDKFYDNLMKAVG